MFEILAKLLSVMDNNWKGKIIGATSDGAASMMGRYEGSVTYIQKEARPGFVQVWCGLHQLDIVVRKTVTKFFDDNFYSTLTGLF